MGFGFVVARFALFLQQFELVQRLAAAPSYGLSLWFGTALIFVGVLVNIVSAWNHFRLLHPLEQDKEPHARASALAIVLACFLAIVGLAMTIYLII
jgi:putative membrane protein